MSGSSVGDYDVGIASDSFSANSNNITISNASVGDPSVGLVTINASSYDASSAGNAIVIDASSIIHSNIDVSSHLNYSSVTVQSHGEYSVSNNLTLDNVTGYIGSGSDNVIFINNKSQDDSGAFENMGPSSNASHWVGLTNQPQAPAINVIMP